MSEISPDRFIKALVGYQKTAAMKAALALDLFGAIEGEDGDPFRIAARTGASQRGVRILCDYLTVEGFLGKDRGRYRLAPDSAVFLRRGSPAWMGSVAEFLASPEMISLWLDDPVSCVRNGGSAGLGNIAPDHPIWTKFARAMVPMVAPATEAVVAEIKTWPTAPGRILDVAAGHGMFGITLARSFPGAQVTAIDWKAVLEVAEENAATAGVRDRYRGVPGSAFEVEWGGGFDLVLLANFLHHFDRPTCVGLLDRARRSLADAGRVLAVEFVPDEDRVSPPIAAAFAFVMLATTPAGDAYTASELDAMGLEAGFTTTRLIPIEGSPQSLVSFAAE